MTTERILKDYGINWIWYCHVDVVDGYVTILKEYRIHKGDEGHPKADGEYRMIERTGLAFGELRVIEGISIDGVEYTLRQPVERWNVTKIVA
jgi:hypothetical protein